MLILDLWGISFHPVVVVGLGNDLLFNFIVGHCAQLPGAGRTRAGHHHGSPMPTSSEAVLLGPNKSAGSISRHFYQLLGIGNFFLILT